MNYLCSFWPKGLNTYGERAGVHSSERRERRRNSTSAPKEVPIPQETDGGDWTSVKRKAHPVEKPHQWKAVYISSGRICVNEGSGPDRRLRESLKRFLQTSGLQEDVESILLQWSRTHRQKLIAWLVQKKLSSGDITCDPVRAVF